MAGENKTKDKKPKKTDLRHMKTLKVVELGLSDRIYKEFKKPGFSVQKLVAQLKSEGYDIGQHAIYKFLKKNEKIQKEMIKKDIRKAADFTNLIEEYKQTIMDILEEVKEVKEQCLNEKEYKAYSNLIGRIYQGIELLQKLSKEISSIGKIDVKILYQEINNNMSRKAMQDKQKIFNDVIDVENLVKSQDQKIAQEIRGDIDD